MQIDAAFAGQTFRRQMMPWDDTKVWGKTTLTLERCSARPWDVPSIIEWQLRYTDDVWYRFNMDRYRYTLHALYAEYLYKHKYDVWFTWYTWYPLISMYMCVRVKKQNTWSDAPTCHVSLWHFCIPTLVLWSFLIFGHPGDPTKAVFSGAQVVPWRTNISCVLTLAWSTSIVDWCRLGRIGYH